MSFVEVALNKRGKRLSDFGICSATITHYEQINGSRFIIKRPKSGFASLPSYMNAFNEEFEKGVKLNHPNILRYLSKQIDEQGPFIVMETDECNTLRQSLKEHPASLTEAHETDRIIHEILDAVEYLHQNGIGHYNLNPSTVLLTKHTHTVKIINPSSFYMDCKPSVIVGNSEWMAPEVCDDTLSPSKQTDIYSIGHLINFIFTYSILPLKYKKVIEKCTNENPAKRYHSIQEIRRAIKTGAIKQKGIKFVFGLFIVAIITAFVLSLIDNMQDDQTTFIKPAQNSEHTIKYLKNDQNAEAYNILADSLESMSPEEKKQQRLYEEKARAIINKQITQKAQNVINKMYTRNSFEGNETDFRQAAQEGFSEIQQLTEELATQYGMDPNDVANMAKDVVHTLTQKRMQEIEAKNKKENE